MDVRNLSSVTSLLGGQNIQAPGEIRGGTQSPTEAGGEPPADRSEVSSIARTLANAAAQPEVRHDLVAGLQQRIASGSYSVAPQDVATAMLRNLGG
jgi:flagellar biosynthesis anti-sigma factor FlgM